MKRARDFTSIAYNTRSKRPCLISPNESKPVQKPIWISASHVNNYMLNDTLVDWLKIYNKPSYHLRPFRHRTKIINTFSEFIMDKGVEFEKNIISYINSNKMPIVKVSNFIDEESCKKTISLMKEGVPAMHSAPVQNHHNNTRGIIDILIRSDYLDKLVDDCPLTEDEKYTYSPKLNKNYHYVVIDVKFSTLPLRADGRTLLNCGRYPAYKSQLLIYNQAIGKIQGYTPRYAYILGKKWKYTSKDINYEHNNCLNKLGVIDYEGIDNKFVSETMKAISWLKDVSKNGVGWSIDPPSRKELYPNMNIDSGKWNFDKEKIANNIGEITTVWNCGIKHRENAFLKNIKSWKNPRCTSSVLGIYGNRADIIDKIMSINRQDVDMILPKKIKSNMFNWKKCKNELFVDFETISNVFKGFNSQTGDDSKTEQKIFMIGVGYIQDKKWNYKHFTCSDLSDDEEYRIMDEFISFVKSRKNPTLWHWTNAEKSFWEKSENKQFEIADNVYRKNHISNKWGNNKFTDLSTLFHSEPIVLKNCFNFKLKDIAKAMRNNKMIQSSYTGNCKSGYSAMISALEYYTTNSDNNSVLSDIQNYNETDCKILYEILNYLRGNHI